jgi:hypothetical protein
MDKEQREAAFGPEAQYSEHKRGETIRFTEGGQEKQGTIIHVIASSQAVVDGEMHPLTYVVDTGKGFPSMIYAPDVLP